MYFRMSLFVFSTHPFCHDEYESVKYTITSSFPFKCNPFVISWCAANVSALFGKVNLRRRLKSTLSGMESTFSGLATGLVKVLSMFSQGLVNVWSRFSQLWYIGQKDLCSCSFVVHFPFISCSNAVQKVPSWQYSSGTRALQNLGSMLVNL